MNCFEILFSDNEVTKRVVIEAKDQQNAVRIFRKKRSEGFKTALTYTLPIKLTGFLVKKL